MRRAFAIVLSVIIFSYTVSIAEVDTLNLDGLSQEQLINLRDAIYIRLNAPDALWLEEKWASGGPVILEPGVYCVGKDIPAGIWNLELAEVKVGWFTMTSALEPDGQLSVAREDLLYSHTLPEVKTVELLVDTYFEISQKTVFKRDT